MLLPNKKRAAGFTLAELMIALSLSGALLSLLYSLLYSSSRQWKVLRQKSVTMRQARTIFDRIGKDLDRAVPFGPKTFRGGPSHMEFYTRIDLRNARTGELRETAARIKYSWEKRNSIYVLDREWRAFLPETWSAPLEGSERFSAPLKDLVFKYALSETENSKPLWKSVWDAPSFPAGVKIEMKLKAEGAAEITLQKIADTPAYGL